MENYRTRISGILLTTAILATGCGGGGGGSNSQTNPTYTAPVAITSDNGVAIARAVISGGQVAESYATTPPSKTVTSASSNTDSTPSYQRIIDQALNSARRAISGAKTPTSATAKAVTTDTIDCPGGGTFSVTWNDANDNLIEDGGDTLSLVDNQCKTIESWVDDYGNTFTDTYTSNGTTTFNLTTLSGDPSVPGTDWSMGFTFSMNNTSSYSSTDGSYWSFSTQGGATIAASYVAATTIISASMTGSSLKQAYSTGGINISVELADFNFAQTMNSNLRTYTFDIDYTLRSSQIGGSVTVVTDPVFAGPIANNLPLPPTSGKMVITGANNTKITVEADADDTATITVNNDGPRNVYWTSELGW